MAQDPVKSKTLEHISHIEHGFWPADVAPPEPLAKIHQIHGSEVFHFESHHELNPTDLPKADGGMTQVKDLWLGVQTADCLPVLFANQLTHQVAAIHAGWRGLLAGILPKTVELFEQHGVRAKDLVVAIGPAIGPCCFEVGQEVISEFETKWGFMWAGSPKKKPWVQGRHTLLSGEELLALKNDGVTTVAPDKASVNSSNLWLDLKAIATFQLVNCGVIEANIDNMNICTYCGTLRLHGEVLRPETNDFASFRRAGHHQKKAGRQWSAIRYKEKL